MFEIACLLVSWVVLIACCSIERVVVHRTSLETLLIHDLVVNVMNKHDQDVADEAV